jgi:hypothetical protein
MMEKTVSREEVSSRCGGSTGAMAEENIAWQNWFTRGGANQLPTCRQRPAGVPASVRQQDAGGTLRRLAFVVAALLLLPAVSRAPGNVCNGSSGRT